MAKGVILSQEAHKELRRFKAKTEGYMKKPRSRPRKPRRPVASGGGAVVFSIKSLTVGTDYIEAYRLVNGVPDTGTIYKIALPYPLRKTPFDGKSITYSATQHVTYSYITTRERQANTGTALETQWINPPYYAGEPIWAIKCETLVDGCDYMDIGDKAWCKE